MGSIYKIWNTAKSMQVFWGFGLIIRNAKFLLHDILICLCSSLKAVARSARGFQGPCPSNRRDVSALPSARATYSAWGKMKLLDSLNKRWFLWPSGLVLFFFGGWGHWNKQKTNASPQAQPAASRRVPELPEGTRAGRRSCARRGLLLAHRARPRRSRRSAGAAAPAALRARQLWGWRAYCPFLPPLDVLVSHSATPPPRHGLSGNWRMDLLSSHPARPPPGRERRNVVCLSLATSGTRSKCSHFPEFAHLELKPTGRFTLLLFTLSAMSSRI